MRSVNSIGDGIEAVPHAYPWMVYSLVKAISDKGYKGCGGSLINRRWVTVGRTLCLRQKSEKVHNFP